ncbi:hypothetical protein ACFQ1S_08875 [Kibdelosporangium lantanae]|uniref:Sigma-70 family RNA polymerase sigma factor n=1 Tax=Kibdelosporangium lantanae TaxID=1497396 RepID=A0ABW3M6J8_9PSEU
MRLRTSLDLARDAFAKLVTGPHPLCIPGTPIAGFPERPIPLDEARDLLLTRQWPQSTSDAVWARLVDYARTEDDTWTIAAIGVAMPALVSVSTILSSRCPGDPIDVQEEVLGGFLEALNTIDITRPRIMLRLRWAAYRAGHAALINTLKHRHIETAELPVPDRRPQHPDLVLAKAVADRVLTATDADLISATRLGSTPIRRWAADHNVTNWAAYKARRRAEFRLAEHLDPTSVSKTDPDTRLQKRGKQPRTVATAKERPCA